MKEVKTVEDTIGHCAPRHGKVTVWRSRNCGGVLEHKEVLDIVEIDDMKLLSCGDSGFRSTDTCHFIS